MNTTFSVLLLRYIFISLLLPTCGIVDLTWWCHSTTGLIIFYSCAIVCDIYTFCAVVMRSERILK